MKKLIDIIQIIIYITAVIVFGFGVLYFYGVDYVNTTLCATVAIGALVQLVVTVDSFSWK